jgi:hypothetical protein
VYSVSKYIKVTKSCGPAEKAILSKCSSDGTGLTELDLRNWTYGAEAGSKPCELDLRNWTYGATAVATMMWQGAIP